MTNILPFFPFLFFVLWISLLVYLVVLAGRLVTAAEQIARILAERLPAKPQG